MAISTYSELKSAITNWMTRNDLSGETADFITLAEAGLNRELSAIEADATLATVAGSDTIDVSSLSIDDAKVLFLVDNGEEREIQRSASALMLRSDTEGWPEQWALDGSVIRFNRPVSAVYSARLNYDQRFSLSDAAPTNWLLTNHPDIYLAACIVWGMGMIRDDRAAQWKYILDEGIASIQRATARRKEALLRIDPALSPRGRFDVETGGLA